jgi:hypothetical protein
MGNRLLHQPHAAEESARFLREARYRQFREKVD